MYKTIAIEIDHGVGIITLDRADRHNAFDNVLLQELVRALGSMSRDDSVRVVVLSAAGGDAGAVSVVSIGASVSGASVAVDVSSGGIAASHVGGVGAPCRGGVLLPLRQQLQAFLCELGAGLPLLFAGR